MSPAKMPLKYRIMFFSLVHLDSHFVEGHLRSCVLFTLHIALITSSLFYFMLFSFSSFRVCVETTVPTVLKETWSVNVFLSFLSSVELNILMYSHWEQTILKVSNLLFFLPPLLSSLFSLSGSPRRARAPRAAGYLRNTGEKRHRAGDTLLGTDFSQFKHLQMTGYHIQIFASLQCGMIQWKISNL